MFMKSSVITIIGNHYPNNRISQYNTIQDKTQVFYYEAMNGAGGGEGGRERDGAIVVTVLLE